MSAELPDVLADPIFQLNLTLWMLQPLPGMASTRPVLREAGYTLDSISRPLPFPFAMRAAVAAAAGSHDAPCPDVLAAGPTQFDWLIIECKGAGFGPDSSAAKQATKLLAGAPDLTEPLALAPGGARSAHLTYLTRNDHREALAGTLEELRARLAAGGLRAGKSGAFGLSREVDGVYIERSAGGSWPAPVEQMLPGPTRVIQLDADEDPRPLYFIPWDPGVDQGPAARDECKAILFARIATEATSEVGRTELPARVLLDVGELLSRATYGVSRRWRYKGDIDKVLRECKRFLADAVAPLKERLALALPSGPERLEFTLQTENERDATIDCLMKANPLKKLPTVEDENQLPLFPE